MFQVKDVATDWMKVGTMLSVSQWLKGGSLSDGDWVFTSLFTLLGFTVYQVVTRALLTPPNLKGTSASIADDTLKFGTMFLVSRLASAQSPFDSKWLIGCLGTLIGFAVYNLIVAKYVKGDQLTYNPKLQMVIDDWAKVGTMLVVARMVAAGGLFDSKWAMESLSVILGFSTYDLVTSHLLDKMVH
jgi:hypothetical protein